MSDDMMADLVEVRRCWTRGEAEQHALVLAAIGIECLLVPARQAVGVYVSAPDADRAREQLALYERENAGGPPRSLPFRAALDGLEPALAYGIVLVLFFVAQRTGTWSIDWTDVGMARAGPILDGQWWRALTALTLHADLGHLIANLAFGIGAALVAAQLLGAGLAWLGIVLAGGLGNGINAAIQPVDHAAVGASTAVFGAVGILSAYRQAADPNRWTGGLRRWAPVAAGVMLLAFLGFGGERTDVVAHVTGFGMGVAIGYALAHVPQRLVERPWVQPASGALACALVASAWLSALPG